jgi:ParB family chromosome partitioning protein
MPVSEIVVDKRYRQDLGDIAGLAKSIHDLGLLQPIVVRPDKQIVAGARRLAAVTELGWTEVDVRVVDNLDDALLALRAEHDENHHRKAFTPSEAVAIGQALEELEKAKAKERQAQARGKPLGTKKADVVSGGNLPPESADSGKTRDRIGEAVGMSGRTYEKAKEVVEAAQENPELRPVVEEMDRTGKVEPAFKKVQAKHGKKKRPAANRALDDETKAILGRHGVCWTTSHMQALNKITDPARRQGAARLLVEGKAKNVKEALAILDAPAAQPLSEQDNEIIPQDVTVPAQDLKVLHDAKVMMDDVRTVVAAGTPCRAKMAEALAGRISGTALTLQKAIEDGLKVVRPVPPDGTLLPDNDLPPAPEPRSDPTAA